jgi:hypothetical protein
MHGPAARFTLSCCASPAALLLLRFSCCASPAALLLLRFSCCASPAALLLLRFPSRFFCQARNLLSAADGRVAP